MDAGQIPDDLVGVVELVDDLIIREPGQIGMAIRMIGDLVAIEHDLLREIGVVVDPVTRQEKGDMQPTLAHDLQTLRRPPAALVAPITRQCDYPSACTAVRDL